MPTHLFEFSVNDAGEVTLHPARTFQGSRSPRKDRFDAVRGSADVRWRTDDLMKLLRPDN